MVVPFPSQLVIKLYKIFHSLSRAFAPTLPELYANSFRIFPTASLLGPSFILSNFRCCLQEKWPYFRNGQNNRVRFEDIVRAKWLACSLFLFLWLPTPGAAQTHQGPSQRIDAAPTADDATRDRISSELAKRINLQRQAALKADTDKLVKLAGELKEYVDKSNENVLSVDVLKKAEEIEKLAHSVKDKMKGPN